MADISQITLPDGTTYDIKDPVARAAAGDAGAGKIFYGVCSTAAATQTKVVTIDDFELFTGALIAVKFENVNTATSPKLNISGTGAINMYSVGTTAVLPNAWVAGETLLFVYNGTSYMVADGGIASTSGYGVTKLNSSTSSTSTTEAATPSAVKSAYDLALEAKTSASDGKSLIASAITGKGVSTSATDTFATMADNIDNIQTGHTIMIDGEEYDNDINLTLSSTSWSQPSGVSYAYEYIKAAKGYTGSYFPATVILVGTSYYIFMKVSPYYAFSLDISTGTWSTFDVTIPSDCVGHVAWDGSDLWCVGRGSLDTYNQGIKIYKYNFSSGAWTLTKSFNASAVTSYRYCTGFRNIEFYNNCLYIIGAFKSSTSSSSSTYYSAFSYDTVNDVLTSGCSTQFSKFYTYNNEVYTFWSSPGSMASQNATLYIYKISGASTNYTATQVNGFYGYALYSYTNTYYNQYASYYFLNDNGKLYLANLASNDDNSGGIFELSSDFSTLTYFDIPPSSEFQVSYDNNYFYAFFKFRGKFTLLGCKHLTTQSKVYSVTL